jgi:hypothetical protein
MSNYYGSAYSNPSGNSGDGGGYYGNYGHQQSSSQPPYGANSAPAYANPNQWQQPSSAAPQQQPSNQQPSFWNPAAAATVAAMASQGMSNPDAMFNFASSAGKSFLESSSARMIPGLESLMVMLRRYFAVDNRYVKRKMQRVVFPFLTKSWKRMVSDWLLSLLPVPVKRFMS